MENHLIHTAVNGSHTAVNGTGNGLNQQAILDLTIDKAVAQGKYEIAANILHDIGNAVVGLGAYMTRIQRSLEGNDPGNLQKLTDFFTSQHTVMTSAIGQVKADALINMLTSITKDQKINQEEISKSVVGQHQIITHIQEILNVPRQFGNDTGTQDKKPTHLRGIINDCISMLLASIEKRGIILSSNVPLDLPAINCNRTSLMQVILNILKNSIEAIDLNSARKTISLNVFTQDDLLVLQVHDSGSGFDEPTGKNLFRRGFTTKSSGTGLGLDSCRAIIESHEGTIEITSEGPGMGALTTIELKI